MIENLWVSHEKWQVECMTEYERYDYDGFNALAWQAYAKLGPKSTRLLNAMNCAMMTIDLKYVGMIFVYNTDRE